MKLVNLFFLKGMNGMFFYCLDYIADQEVVILLRKGNNLKFPPNKNHTFVEVNSFLELVWFIFTRKYEILFCPTPHPIPFAANQIVTLHDVFPFKGFKGNFKYVLLMIGAISSGAKIVLINQLLSKKIFTRFIPLKTIYGPNSIELREKILKGGQKDFKIGLIGTDSSKKNYEKLFKDLPPEAIKNFAIYGNTTNYSDRIMASFGAYGLSHIKTEECSLESFINNCEGIASVATGEGFGRPIAFSLLLGKPVFLIDDPTFKEFYDGSCRFYDNVESLSEHLNYLIKCGKIGSMRIETDLFQKKVEVINKSFFVAQKEIFRA